MSRIVERLRRIVFAASVQVDNTIASEKSNGFTGTKKFLSGFFWCFVAPLALTACTKKAHLYSAHKLGIPGDLKQLGVEYELATSVPARLRNDVAKTFIRRARIIDYTTTALRVLVLLRACRY